MKEYKNRIADKLLRYRLEEVGAVLIEGPKWCGKATTAEQLAKSVLYMADPDNQNSYMEKADLKIKMLLKGDAPRLIDEWQIIPQIWDAIRFEVDHRGEEGQDAIEGYNKLGIEDIAFLVCRGGWPSATTKNQRAALRLGPADLVNDLETFGLLFETLCVRDLRVYADAIDGSVYHYRDKNGLECDAVIHLRNGSYGLIEIKLGGAQAIEKGVNTLTSLASKIDTTKMKAPSFLMVLTAVGDYAYQRKDGVYVVPIGCLKD